MDKLDQIVEKEQKHLWQALKDKELAETDRQYLLGRLVAYTEVRGLLSTTGKDVEKEAILKGADMVRQVIARNREEAERDGDDEWIEENEAGWSNVLNGIEEIKESLED